MNGAASPVAWLARNAARTPDEPALIGADGSTTWLQLWRQVRELARALTTGGLRPGEVVAHGAPPAESLRLLFALPLAGAIAYPLDPNLPPPLRERLLRDAGCEWGLGPGWPERVRELRPHPTEATASDDPLLPAPEALHLIVASGGSGGAPRGVMHRGASLSAAVLAARSRLGLVAGERWLCPLPLFHIGGIAIALRCAEAAAAVVLHGRFEPRRLMEELERHAVTHISLVPTQLARLTALGRRPPPTLRVALVGGAPLSESLAHEAAALGWPLCASYGASECASQVATRCGIDGGWRFGEVGRPLDGFRVQVSGGEGRIHVSGPALMAGYATPGRAVGVGLEPDGGLLTGDLGRLDGEGNLTLLGRADRVVVSGGEKVVPELLEALIGDHPRVVEVAVVGVPDPEWGERVEVLLVGEVAPEELMAWCRERLAGAWCPKAIHPVAALPRTPMGKLDYAALRSMLL